ncbi:hypothetical protein CB0940_05776 [Cercospora beticola]|uniref:Uncharacterized protein n=1 Tax=Cercospora beticola TaxID=122368 RepID=A0A2G5HY77_CERBT|nr:hypothetical protein CB0940_05776 [Cercospora beticola]PIA97202.1 hypothetical protein CB0940_05776 [Cercospora beticola]WPA98358.1 hypothetical protein RHO25_002970 [Cercospora beticola]CAK1359598.1 unnamed protein product [Cercospora beticola]
MPRGQKAGGVKRVVRRKNAWTVEQYSVLYLLYTQWQFHPSNARRSVIRALRQTVERLFIHIFPEFTYPNDDTNKAQHLFTTFNDRHIDEKKPILWRTISRPNDFNGQVYDLDELKEFLRLKRIIEHAARELGIGLFGSGATHPFGFCADEDKPIINSLLAATGDEQLVVAPTTSAKGDQHPLADPSMATTDSPAVPNFENDHCVDAARSASTAGTSVAARRLAVEELRKETAEKVRSLELRVAAKKAETARRKQRRKRAKKRDEERRGCEETVESGGRDDREELGKWDPGV